MYQFYKRNSHITLYAFVRFICIFVLFFKQLRFMSLTYVTFLLLDFIYCHINLLRLFRLITQHCKKKTTKKTVIQVGGLASIKPKIKLLLFFLGGKRHFRNMAVNSSLSNVWFCRFLWTSPFLIYIRVQYICFVNSFYSHHR